VTSVREGAVDYGGGTLKAETILWAAGVLASPAAKWLGVDADRAGRILVNPDLGVPGHPNVFAVGDTVAAKTPDGKPVPGIGDAAKQGGRHAARVIKARLRGRADDLPFRYSHLGDIATIGRSRALIDFGWLRLTGWIGWWAWGLAHIYFLIGLKNRIFIALNWLWIYLTGYRSARLITQDMPTGAALEPEPRESAGQPRTDPKTATFSA
jgi:NADH dehydrogenase